jgi:polyisoprenyl-phosphate glycosyltransferase
MSVPSLLSVVIPCYRSEASVAATVKTLLAELGDWCALEVILVNDGSPDNVQSVIEQLARDDARVQFVELGTNHGQHFATLCGFRVSRGDCVVTVDDDGQNPPSAVKAIVTALMASTHDIVYGSFASTRQSAFRVLGSRMNRFVSKHTIGNHGGISISNVRAIRGDLARAVAQVKSSAPYIDALLWGCTRRIAQVQVEHRPRVEGASTYTLWKLFSLWMSHLTLLTVLPLRFASIGSLTVSIAAFVLATVQFSIAIQIEGRPPGWLSLFLVVTMLFGVLFAFLAIVSTYLGRLYVELNGQQLEWIRSTSAKKEREVLA